MLKKFLFSSFVFFCITYSMLALSWNNAGHQVIAAIAYQNLNPATKNVIDELTREMFTARYGDQRFMLASAWADIIRYHDVQAFNTWHFINYPYSMDGNLGQPAAKENVVWAIQQSIQSLASPKANRQEKALFLKFLVHFVGDIHQPLHCATLYSKAYPQGDKGGNLFPIQSFLGDNLHVFWDRGGGLLYRKMHKNRRFRMIREMADQLSQEYPQSFFKIQLADSNPDSWARESFTLAKNVAYKIQPNTTPSKEYVKTSQKITKKQLVLAGYRLAQLLNTICGEDTKNCQPYHIIAP